MLSCGKKLSTSTSDSSQCRDSYGIDSGVNIQDSNVSAVKTFLTEKDIDRLVKEVMRTFSDGNILLQTGRIMSEDEYKAKREAALKYG